MNFKNLHISSYLLAVAILLTVLAGCKENSKELNSEDSHPKLLLSSAGVAQIQAQLGKNELIDKAFNSIKEDVELALENGISVPVPIDAGGGYIHELHKKNGILLYEAGLLYQITKDEKYARFSKEMLEEYAKLYPTLPLHPERKTNEQTAGKLFWQGLNDCMWLVYGIQGYDFVYEYLSPEERKEIEAGLFLPMATFLSDSNAYTFNRIHNHGTWAVAAVGMSGYVLGNNEMVEKSLKGLNKDGNGGFLAQLSKLFSPDGYFTEGPYYQRFAMMPFIVFAEAIQKNDPSINIFAYNDSILSKAVNTAMQLTYTNGAFFPLNDGLKDKTFETIEMVFSANIAYAELGQNPGLLDIAQRQGKVSLTDAGVITAEDWKAGKEQPFLWKSMFLSDGANGDEGGIGILRAGPNSDQSCLLMKSTSHGLAHGHYDKLGIVYYDNNTEILRDYGAARFLNIEAKYGGRYLPENVSWAKQSIAHNTITVDETCQFGGDFNTSSMNHPVAVLFSAENKDLQYMSALDTNAYPGISMYRTMILATIPSMEFPIILDLFQLETDKTHQYDLPFYYNGQFIETGFETEFYTRQINALGTDNGYQHLWLKGKGKSETENAQFTWMANNRFYTLTSLTDKNTEVLFTTIGAGDPNSNLRNESAIMLRQDNTGNHLFVNIIEPHGEFNPIEESTKAAVSQIKTLSASAESDFYTITFELQNGEAWEFQVPAMNSNKKEITYKQLK